MSRESTLSPGLDQDDLIGPVGFDNNAQPGGRNERQTSRAD
jgi:hypothetical protein